MSKPVRERVRKPGGFAGFPASRRWLFGLAIATSSLAAGIGPVSTSAHHPGATAADHFEEDTVVHSPAKERRLGRRTEAATASDAEAAAEAVAAADAGLVGEWGPVVNWPVVGVHVALLTSGKVLAYDSVGDNATETYSDHSFTRATIWDPETEGQLASWVTGFNLFCSGLAHLLDGTLFTAGGNKNSSLHGIRQTHTFDAGSNTWTRTADMAHERWYPSVTPLRNGEMLITEGGPDIPEVREVNGSMRALNSASLNLPLYPWLDVAPDGRAFYSGPDQTMRSLDPTGAGSWQSHGPRDTVNRDYGSHALYDIGKTLVAGGGNSVSSARVIDLNGPVPLVSTTGSMATGRRQHNLTVLADGTVLATGGNSNGAGLVDLDFGVYTAELWDPADGQWQTLASMQVTRQYHSTALLLPDGRVLSSGGGICGDCDSQGYLAKNAEVFSPPYLFKNDGSGELAPRPEITSAPEVVGYDTPFSIATPSAASIGKVALVRLGAVTHSVNMEQRYVPLSFTNNGGTIDATVPPNANVTPPGVYMLFVIGTDGVPSEAKMVRVADAATVSTAGDVITYTGGGDDTVVVDDPSAGVYSFTQTGSTPITESSSSCTLAGNVVTCTDAAGDANWDSVTATMGAGADSFSAAAVNQGDPFTVTDSGSAITSTLTGSDGNDSFNSTGINTISGGAGNDTIVSGANADALNGGAGNDTIDGGGGGDIINGDDNNDTLYGGADGTDDINGGNGNDRMDGGLGAEDDDYDGGAGIDRVVYGSLTGFTYACAAQNISLDLDNNADDDSCANAGKDDENVRSSVESITGSTTADTMTGTCGANTFAGSAGIANGNADGGDFFNGDPAGCVAGDARSDFFGGGEGGDDFNGDGSGVAGFDTVTYGAPYTGVGAVNIDWGGGNDDADGMGNMDDIQIDIDRVVGGGAGDTINAAAATISVTLLGHGGDDILTGSPQVDTIDGEAGADTLNCGASTDFYRHDGLGPAPVACEALF